MGKGRATGEAWKTGRSQVMQGLEGMERSVDLFQIRGQQTRPRCLFLYGL